MNSSFYQFLAGFVIGSTGTILYQTGYLKKGVIWAWNGIKSGFSWAVLAVKKNANKDKS